MEVGWGGGVGWWETSVSWHPTYPTLAETTGPKKLRLELWVNLVAFGPGAN